MTLHYTFPTIRHVSQVRNVIAGNPHFIEYQKPEGYTVFDYLVSGDHTFPKVDGVDRALLRELRGLKFDTATGELVCRPYHKFFNLGERSDSPVDLSQRHFILEKLDGSMVAPFKLNGQVYWSTKMEPGPAAKQAQDFVKQHPEYQRLADATIRAGVQAIFEWVSPHQPIVLRYSEPRLVLTAARNMKDGRYIPHDLLELIAENYDVPCVKTVERAAGMTDEEFYASIKAQEGVEGIVIRFVDGHMVKVKGDWYIARHRAKEGVRRVRSVVALILDNGMDDVYPLLDQFEHDRVKMIEDALDKDISWFSLVFAEEWEFYCRTRTKKDYALGSTGTPQAIRGAVFHVADRERAEGVHSATQAATAAMEHYRGLVMKHSVSSNSYFAKGLYLLPNVKKLIDSGFVADENDEEITEG